MASTQIPTWESTFSLSLQGPLDELPRKAVDLLPRFKGHGNASANEHIRKYELICLMLFMKMLFAGYFHSHSKVRLFAGSMFCLFIQFIIGLNLKICSKILLIIMIWLRFIKIFMKCRWTMVNQSATSIVDSDRYFLAYMRIIDLRHKSC